MNIKNVTAVLGIGLALLMGVIALNKTAPALSPIQIGAIVGPEETTNYHCWNGVCEYFESKNLGLATTTPCSLRSPSATSTLVSASLEIKTATSSKMTADLATSTTAFASTTVLQRFTGAANQNGIWSYVASSTTETADRQSLNFSRNILPPNTYIVWKWAADSTGISYASIVGSCNAVFLK